MVKKKHNKEKISKEVEPDIIIHKRGKQNLNMLIIEIKKSKRSATEVIYDIMKIETFIKSDMNYHYGLFLLLDPFERKVIWYKSSGENHYRWWFDKELSLSKTKKVSK